MILFSSGARRLCVLLALFSISTALCEESPQKIAFTWNRDSADDAPRFVEISGLSPETLQELRKAHWNVTQWQRLCPVYARPFGTPSNDSLPPMAGSYSVRGDRVHFEPAFPMVRGVSYSVVLHFKHLPGNPGPEGAVRSASSFAERATLKPSTVVSQVYPSADLLPENLLKFYLHFSAPMSGGRIYDHIQLRDAEGKLVELPFLEIDEELWDPEMRRLTLFIDPGRIKRGVRPLEEIGPALESGKRYTLIIDSAWKDATGTPLRESFRKSFQVGPSDRQPPDPAHWKLDLPKARTRQPLAISFSEPLDHALARRMIRVRSGKEEAVPGRVSLADHEQRWLFTPDQPWRQSAYALVMDTNLEDLAGNSIGKPFEVDLFEPVQRTLTNTTAKLDFEIR